MASQKELDSVYMEVARSHAKLSKAQRKKVGCALVTKTGVILAGTNGLAPGGSNELEHKQYMNKDSGGWLDVEDILETWPFADDMGRYKLVTKEETIHAELSCVLKAAKEGVSIVGSTLYTTLSCCKPCSEMIAAAGVARVVYDEEYRDLSGIENLSKLNVMIEKFN